MSSKSIVGGIFVLALALAEGGAAWAGAWQDTFVPEAVGRMATPGRTRVSLVAGGEQTPQLAEARGALVQAMKASGRFDIVDADLVREVDEDFRDTGLVAMERDARDVQVVWVLRIRAAGPPAAASVAIYSSLGQPLDVFYVTEGQPFVAGARTFDGESVYLAQRISPVEGDAIVTAPAPERFGSDAGFAKDGMRLEEPRDLYLAMERYDLVRAYDDVAEDRFLVRVISGGVVFVGVVLFMQDVFDSGGIPTMDIGPLGWTGVAVAALGAAGVVVSFTIDPDPLDHAGKVAAATTYNGALRQRLSLPPVSYDAAPGPRLERVGVGALSGGLGLTLRGTF